MEPDREDRDLAGARAKNRVVEVGAGAAVMERGLAASVSVQIAEKKPNISRALPVWR